MIIEIFDAFLVRIIKLFHRNFIVTIFVSVLIVLVRRKYKLSDIKNELNFIWNDTLCVRIVVSERQLLLW